MPPQRPFVDLAGEQLTVSGTSVGITAALLQTDRDVNGESKSGQQLEVYRAVFTHDSGGNIYHRSDGSAATNAGASGEIPQGLGSQWEITGYDDILNWVAIKKSGEADAVLSVRLYGRSGGV